jgi:dihydrofolate reductase
VRKVTFGVGCSLDGFIGRDNDDVDRLHWSDDVARLSAAYWDTIDTVLMGRRTYDVAVRAGTSAYSGVANYVFSRTLQPGLRDGVTVVSEDPARFTEGLRGQDGRGICVMGGGELASCLLRGGQLDEIVLDVHPIIVGGGVPAFRPIPSDVELELVEHQALQNGCLLLTYRVLR